MVLLREVYLNEKMLYSVSRRLDDDGNFFARRLHDDEIFKTRLNGLRKGGKTRRLHDEKMYTTTKIFLHDDCTAKTLNLQNEVTANTDVNIWREGGRAPPRKEHLVLVFVRKKRLLLPSKITLS